ncbi:MAG: carboxylesterase family protein [Paludibacteraceae bacterium]|nr:carboxylesterase family protein [Paludibacteraceae bacterium]
MKADKIIKNARIFTSDKANPEATALVVKDGKFVYVGDYDRALAVKCINGTFVGAKQENVISYKGIPYVGKQPVGNLRWKAPVAFVPDEGVYDASHFAKMSVQDLSIGENQGEDCLYLNVYKAEGTAQKRPVMVWIHGGAFVAGGTSMEVFDCTNLVQEHPDIIFVTVAYRLGVLGMLHLSHLADGKDYPDAQNLTLLDQKMALQWVHENIAAFGGDPENVTIWGESAGGASVSMQPLVPGSQQYFQKVIAQSGAPCQTNSLDESIATTNDLLAALGCKTVAELLKIDARTLIDTAAEVVRLRIFPVRDGRILPLDPWEAYKNGIAKNITFLQGCNKDEMNCFVSDWTVEGFKTWAAERKTHKYAQLLTDEERAKIDSYCREGAETDWDADSKLFGHSWFIEGAIKMSECQTMGGGKSYFYQYRVESSDPIMKCAHFEEVPVLFAHPEFVVGRTCSDLFCQTMRALWIQFAKTGNPSLTAEQSPDGKAHEWPIYDLEDKRLMVLDDNNIHPAKEADVHIVDWERSTFLTNYYML